MVEEADDGDAGEDDEPEPHEHEDLLVHYVDRLQWRLSTFMTIQDSRICNIYHCLSCVNDAIHATFKTSLDQTHFIGTHEDADSVVGLDCARGSVLEVGALGHAGEDGGHRVDPDLGVGLQELDHLE